MRLFRLEEVEDAEELEAGRYIALPSDRGLSTIELVLFAPVPTSALARGITEPAGEFRPVSLVDGIH